MAIPSGHIDDAARSPRVLWRLLVSWDDREVQDQFWTHGPGWSVQRFCACLRSLGCPFANVLGILSVLFLARAGLESPVLVSSARRGLVSTGWHSHDRVRVV